MEKKILIVANWKANKTVEESLNWLKEFKKRWRRRKNVEIVLCPPYTALSPLRSEIRNWKLGIRLGAQDISPFPSGAYTGEVSGEMLKELVDYVLIGHSERRKYFGETEEMVKRKIKRAKEFGIKPIVCVANFAQIPKEKNLILMYEPPSAISKEGVYRPCDPEKVAQTLSLWRKKLNRLNPLFLYGGSVNRENVSSFLAIREVSGVAVGHASLDPEEFFQILKNA